MGKELPPQGSLFHYGFNLDNRIREDHPLRKIHKLIDFDFVYKEVSDKYGSNGNVSVPPPVILKLMLLLVFYNVRSERELMVTLPERLDWLWFLGYDLDSRIPDHSVLSKARKRWGVEVFEHFFERIVFQCVEAGSYASKKDIRLRKSLMERSFARGTRYGFDRARWRRRWRVSIQEYLMATIQNIQILIEHGYNPQKSVAVEIRGVRRDIKGHLLPILQEFTTLKDEIYKIFLKMHISSRQSIVVT